MPTLQIRQPRKRTYRFECPKCDTPFNLDPGTSQFTAEPGEVVTCPWCGYVGKVV